MAIGKSWQVASSSTGYNKLTFSTTSTTPVTVLSITGQSGNLKSLTFGSAVTSTVTCKITIDGTVFDTIITNSGSAYLIGVLTKAGAANTSTTLSECNIRFKNSLLIELNAATGDTASIAVGYEI